MTVSVAAPQRSRVSSDTTRLLSAIEAQLPDRHKLFVNGPSLDGRWYVAVVDTRRGARVVFKDKGTIIDALTGVRDGLYAYTPTPIPGYSLPKGKPAPHKMPKRDDKGRFMPRVVPVDVSPPPARTDTPNSKGEGAQGFTRNRDVVAYLIGKSQRVTQYELREVYGIKNPAQAVNEFEEQYHVRLTTGKRTDNGDIPYTLAAGKLPEIAGMLPMFIDGIEDPDDVLYVNTLQLYVCKDCGRAPVYRPSTAEDGKSYGICPRHGPQEFGLF